MKSLPVQRVSELLENARQTRLLVIGDIMLDQYIWGRVDRISPEAPVPVVEFQKESFMPGGAANVARNLAAMNVPVELFGVVGRDEPARRLKRLLTEQAIGCHGLVTNSPRMTSIKTRILAQQQQVVRVDRETPLPVDTSTVRRLLNALEKTLHLADAIVVGDYGKGAVTQPLLDELKWLCRERGIWLSLDPKPVNELDLSGLSLITPNRKEAFELAGIPDGRRPAGPLEDKKLMQTAEVLLEKLRPAVLLITLGDQGMLLCRRDEPPFHIPTMAREVFDVSGAGDTVIGAFTLAIAAGASPLEASIFSNHAAGVVVGKLGTATVTPDELLATFQ